MACLLVLVVAATLLTAPPGKLTQAARTSPAEAFWRTALPGAPIPEAIRELLLRPGAFGTNAPSDVRAKNDDDDPPIPPMNFKYDDYRSSRRRNEAAAAPSSEVLLNKRVAGAARNEADANAASPTAFFLEEAVRVGEVLPFRSAPRATAEAASPSLRLYTVRAVRAVDGRRFVVCRRREAVYGCRATGPAARAYVAEVAGERGEAVAAVVVCHTDTSRGGAPARAAFRLLDVKPGGAAAVCHAVLEAEVFPVQKDERPSSA